MHAISPAEGLPSATPAASGRTIPKELRSANNGVILEVSILVTVRKKAPEFVAVAGDTCFQDTSQCRADRTGNGGREALGAMISTVATGVLGPRP